jgi:hypothetical protein
MHKGKDSPISNLKVRKIRKMSPNIYDLSLKNYCISKLSFFMLKIEDAGRSTRDFMSVYDSALLVNERK